MILDRKQAEYLLEQMDLGKADAEDIAYTDIKNLKAEVLVAREEKGKYEALKQEVVELREKVVKGVDNFALEQILQKKEEQIKAQFAKTVSSLEAECDTLRMQLKMEHEYQQKEGERLKKEQLLKDKKRKQLEKEVERNRKLSFKELFVAFCYLVLMASVSIIERGNGFWADCVINGRILMNLFIKLGVGFLGGIIGYGIMWWGLWIFDWITDKLFSLNGPEEDIFWVRMSRILSVSFFCAGVFMVVELFNGGIVTDDTATFLYDGLVKLDGQLSLEETVQETKQWLLEKGWMK